MTLTRPITDIWYEKGERQRQDLGDLTDLINSINRVGLINPIVITHDGQLVAGERRLTACKEIGLLHVPVRYLEDLSPRQLKLVELDENIKRKDIDWKEHVRAVTEYARIAKEETPGIGSAGIAEELGIGQSTLHRLLGINKYLEEGHSGITAAPAISVARGIYERAEARKKASGLNELNEALGGTPAAEENITPAFEDTHDAPIIVTDFTQYKRRGPKFNFLHCDFPYGIGASDHDQGGGIAWGAYGDSPETYWNLIQHLHDFTDKYVAESAHMLFWFSMKHYHQTRLALATKWTVQYTPLVWFKSDNRGILPDYRRGPRQVYETAFICTRGDRPIVSPRANCIGTPSSKKYHMSEKPLSMLTHFLTMFVDENTVMLDPTCGSGNALIAAHKLGAKSVLGLEINEEFAERAIDNWKGEVSHASQES